MVFLIEALVLCAAFGLMVCLSLIKNPIAWVADYPPEIARRARELGLTKEKSPEGMKELFKAKLPKLIFTGVLFGLAAFFINGSRGFLAGFAVCLGLWFVIAWFDALVIDCLFFCHSKKVIIPGTEDLKDAYHDYGFHIKMSCIGCLLALPSSLIAGIITWLLSLAVK